MITINPSWVRGIDVSQWQGDIDFAALARGGEVFVISRALYGLSQDSMFAHYYTATEAAGMIRGAYQFGRPVRDSAQASAQAYVNAVNNVGGFDGFPPIIDLEYGADVGSLSPGRLTDWVLTWMGEVKRLAGLQGMLYTSTAFITERLVPSRLAGIPLWDAQYGSMQPNTGPYLKLRLWQYAAQKNSLANVQGIAPYNQVDEDVFIGTKDDLLAWLEEVRGVQQTKVNVNGHDFAAVIVGKDTYILWTELQTLPGFSSKMVNGEWHFTVQAPQAPDPVAQSSSQNVQQGISMIEQGLKLIQG